MSRRIILSNFNRFRGQRRYQSDNRDDEDRPPPRQRTVIDYKPVIEDRGHFGKRAGVKEAEYYYEEDKKQINKLKDKLTEKIIHKDRHNHEEHGDPKKKKPKY